MPIFNIPLSSQYDSSSDSGDSVVMDCHPNSDIVGAEFLFSNILPAMFSLAIVPINAFAQSRFLDDARRGLAFSQLLSGTALFISVYTLDSNGNWNAVIVSACAALALSSSLAVRTADRRYMTPLHSLVGGLLFVFLIFLDVFIINRGSPAIRDSIDIQMPPAMIVVIFIHTATFWCALLTQKWTFWIPSTLFPLAYAALLLYIKYGQTECPMNTGNGSQWSYGQTLSILTIAYPLFKKLEEPSRPNCHCNTTNDVNLEDLEEGLVKNGRAIDIQGVTPAERKTKSCDYGSRSAETDSPLRTRIGRASTF